MITEPDLFHVTCYSFFDFAFYGFSFRSRMHCWFFLIADVANSQDLFDKEEIKIKLKKKKSRDKLLLEYKLLHFG